MEVSVFTSDLSGCPTTHEELDHNHPVSIIDRNEEVVTVEDFLDSTTAHVESIVNGAESIEIYSSSDLLGGSEADGPGVPHPVVKLQSCIITDALTSEQCVLESTSQTLKEVLSIPLTGGNELHGHIHEGEIQNNIEGQICNARIQKDIAAQVQIQDNTSVQKQIRNVHDHSKQQVGQGIPDQMAVEQIDSLSDLSSCMKFEPKQIFSQVKAFLDEVIVKLIPGSVDTFMSKLEEETGIFVENVNSGGCQYVLNGEWGQIVGAHQKVEQCLASASVPLTEINQNSFGASASQTPTKCKVDKAVTCDIIKTGNMTRFAVEHPRQARFASLVFQRAHFPMQRIKEKYRVKRRVERPRKLLRPPAPKTSNRKKQEVFRGRSDLDESSQEKENSDSMDMSGAEDLDSSYIDQLDTENMEPFTSSKNLIEVLGRPRPKKNYEELTPFKFFCKLCSFKTKRESHYQKHVAIHEKVTTLYKCDQCTFTSIRLSHLRRHEMSHSQTTYPCGSCSYKTDDMKLLVRHRKIKHEKDDEVQPKDILHCPECPYKTNKPYHFQRHLRVHSSTMKGSLQLFQCDQCSYKTSRKEHFIRHVSNVHSNKRPYLCDFCGKAFKRTDALKQHRVTHASVDPQGVQFRCSVCEKSCRSHAHLTEHQAVHSNERSFLCEICGASFKTRSVQRKHVLTIHKNPRSYSCEHCDKRFNTNYALRRHLRLHEPGGELARMSPSSPSALAADELPTSSAALSNTLTTVSHQSVILLPASSAAVTGARLRTSTSELSATPTTIPITIHPGVGGGQATIQLAASVLQGSESLTGAESATIVPLQEGGENSCDEPRSGTQTFIQANEATTALLYLTSFTPF